jgi:hypothetical protein
MSDADLPKQETIISITPYEIKTVDITGVNPGDTPQANTPTNTCKPALGSIEGTLCEKSNEERAHACDTMIYLNRSVAFARFLGGQIVAAIRKGIQTALAALGFNPATNGFIEFLKGIKRIADEVTEFLEEIKNAYDAFIGAVAQIRRLIDYILSLPERLIAFFINCLREAYAELQTFFNESVSSFVNSDQSQGLITAATEAFDSVTEAIQTATEVASDVVALPATIIATALGGGSTAEEQDAAAKEFYAGFESTKTYANA